ncbi:MAG: chemotaxis-specific protein-glutamate methyltransferase CheB, partial [Gammaproteobacteria bacterium]
IADDSALSRRVLSRLIDSDSGMKIVGEAHNGKAAIVEAERLQVDIILMDVVMPLMDGLNATREVMRTAPRPIVIVSDLVGREADLNFKALEAGAIDLLRKPSADDLDDPLFARRFVRNIKALAAVPVIRRYRPAQDPAVRSVKSTRAATRTAPASAPASRSGVWPELAMAGVAAPIFIGASTGGPPALSMLLRELDGRISAPIVVVQHMTQGFMAGMAAWLANQLNHTRVQLVDESTRLEPATAYLAPDDAHLKFERSWLVTSALPSGTRHMPSVDVLFESVARDACAGRSTAVLLTGMGSDGARGLLAIKEAGGHTIAQDETSSVVYGMPRAAIEMGAAREILSIGDIANRLGERFGARPAGAVVTGMRTDAKA